MKTLKVILIIVLFLFSFSSLTYTAEAVPTTAGTGVIDSYVKVNSVTKKKNGKISIKYTMKQDFKTKILSVNQSLSIGYDRNNIYKLPGVFKSVNPKKGKHTMTLSKPSPDLLGWQRIKVSYGAQGYGEEKSIKSVYNIPKKLRGVKRTYQTITRTQAAGDKLVTDVLPDIAIVLLFKGGSVTAKNVVRKGTSIASTLVGYNLATGIFKQMPALTAGNVVYYETEFKTNGKIRNRIMIFANKETYKVFVKSKYKKSKLAIYDKSATSNVKY